MYKLTVISGPNRGTSYVIRDGEVSIGRQTGNVIVFSSSKISKRHCTVVVDQKEVMVRDDGSSNGTFVNGVLVKNKKIQPGDRISVGDYVLELVKPQSQQKLSAPVNAVAELGSVIQFPIKSSEGASPGDANAESLGSSSLMQHQAPTDLFGKALWQFESFIMPTFYGLLMKHEWKALGAALFAVLVVGSLFLSVSPLLDSGRDSVVKESFLRARVMAKQIVERNTNAMVARAESKTDIGLSEREPGVRVAVLLDLNNRVIAPAAKMNQYFTSGVEGKVAVQASKRFLAGHETGLVEQRSPLVIAIEPLKLFNPQKGKNEVAAMALVSIDTSISVPALGEIGVVYSQTLIFTGLLAGLILLILYRLTLRPFEALNDDIDKVLKGELSQVTHEFKMTELNSLWDNINSAIQRIPQGGMGLDPSHGSGAGLSASGMLDEISGALKLLGGLSNVGVVLCDSDRKIVYLNPIFEEISGIRLDNALGQDIPTVARDQALGMFVSDLLDRVTPGSDEFNEEFEFSGIAYKVYAVAFGASGGATKAFLLITVRSENG
jgi:PAS domain-containing protein